jgi:hypothetical protein
MLFAMTWSGWREPLLQNLPSTIFVSLRHVEPRQVEVGLIEIARRGGIHINAQDPS